jgi:hypothetical protein
MVLYECVGDMVVVNFMWKPQNVFDRVQDDDRNATAATTEHRDFVTGYTLPFRSPARIGAMPLNPTSKRPSAVCNRKWMPLPDASWMAGSFDPSKKIMTILL